MKSHLSAEVHSCPVCASPSVNAASSWRARLLSGMAGLCAGLMVVSAQAAFQAVDTFDDLNLGTINGQNGWSISGTSGEVVLDPADGSNQALEVSTESGTLEKAMTIARNTTRMLFLRLRFEEHGSYSFGVSFASNPAEFVDFSAELGMAAATTGDPNNDFRVANGSSTGIYDVLDTLTPGTWYNVWVLINNTDESYEVWLNSVPDGDAQASDQQDNDQDETSFGFRTAAGTDLQNLFMKTGGGDSPPNGRFYIDDIYLENTGDTNLSNPVGLVGEDSKDDIVVDFGADTGFWAWMNDANWLKLHPTLSPDLVALANMDGIDEDDVVADFSSTIGGIYVKRNLGSWVRLHPGSSESLTAGDLDNNSHDDLLVDFGATTGFWARMNDDSWLKLHPTLSPDVVATGDVDGNDADDVLASFANSVGGLWSKLNLGGWTRQNPNSPDDVVADDVTGNGADDIVADFGSTVGGIFVKRDQGAWLQLHPGSSESLTTGDLD